MRHLHRFSFSFFHRQLVSSKCILPKSVARSPSGESSSSVVLKSCYLHSIQMQENRKETRLFKSLSLCFLETRMYLWSKKEDGDDDARRRRKGKFFSVHESRRHTVLLYIDCWSEWGVSSSKGKVRTFLEELEEGRLQERKSIHSLLPSQTIIERQKEQQQICCGIRRRTRYLYKFNVSKFLACSSLEFETLESCQWWRHFCAAVLLERISSKRSLLEVQAMDSKEESLNWSPFLHTSSWTFF